MIGSKHGGSGSNASAISGSSSGSGTGSSNNNNITTSPTENKISENSREDDNESIRPMIGQSSSQRDLLPPSKDTNLVKLLRSSSDGALGQEASPTASPSDEKEEHNGSTPTALLETSARARR